MAISEKAYDLTQAKYLARKMSYILAAEDMQDIAPALAIVTVLMVKQSSSDPEQAKRLLRLVREYEDDLLHQPLDDEDFATND